MLISLNVLHVYFSNMCKCCSEDLARVYVAEIICAVSYLHQNGIVHGDLKPQNILLDSEGHVSGCVSTRLPFLSIGGRQTVILLAYAPVNITNANPIL